MRLPAMLMVNSLPEADYWALLDTAVAIAISGAVIVIALFMGQYAFKVAGFDIDFNPALSFVTGAMLVGVLMFFVIADYLFTCKHCRHPLSAHKNRKRTFQHCKRLIFKKGLAGWFDMGKACDCTQFVFALRPFTKAGVKAQEEEDFAKQVIREAQEDKHDVGFEANKPKEGDDRDLPY
jgi:hypothetical protein